MGRVCSRHNLVEDKTLIDEKRSAVYSLHKFQNKYRWVIVLLVSGKGQPDSEDLCSGLFSF
jgi:hypothetical protein